VTFGHEGGHAFNEDQRGGHTDPPLPNQIGRSLRYGRITAEFLPEGADPEQPVFLLIPPDACSVGAVRDYIGRCSAASVGDTHIHGCQRAVEAFERWQQANPDKVKLPD